jgi:hypothetical protein
MATGYCDVLEKYEVHTANDGRGERWPPSLCSIVSVHTSSDGRGKRKDW